MSYKLDLSKIYNHIIYKNTQSEETISQTHSYLHGVNKIHIVEEKVINFRCFNVDFNLDSGNSQFDNISCDGDILYVNNHTCKIICFLGFSEMGTICDNVTLSTSQENIKVPLVLKTFHTNNFKGIDDVGINSNCKIALSCLGDDMQKHYIYFWETDINTENPIIKIQLPVNRTLHILAITLE